LSVCTYVLPLGKKDNTVSKFGVPGVHYLISRHLGPDWILGHRPRHVNVKVPR